MFFLSYYISLLRNVSEKEAIKFIEDGFVCVNGRINRDKNYNVKINDVIFMK